MPLKIGLTGGIGSGKTIAASVFEVLGIPVYYADEAAKRIMNDDPGVKARIIETFGQQSYVNDLLNRSYLAAAVFKDKSKLDLLNSIVHPVTIRDSESWMLSQTTPYAIKEAALIFESGANRQLDKVIGVSAPYRLRIQRVLSRDSIGLEALQQRMENQMDEDEKMQLCDFILLNDEQEMLLPQVLEVHRRLLELAL